MTVVKGLAAAAALAGVASVWVAAPVAAREPAVLAPTFKDNMAVAAPSLAPGKTACAVTFTELKDIRHDTSLVGVISNRTVQSPADTQAWIRAVLGGLPRRGVTPQFADTGAVDGIATPKATFSLQLAWISLVESNFSARVVVTIDATGVDGHELHQSYRGQTVNINWAGVSGEYADALDEAFADALNKMASDLRGLCQG